MGTKILSLIIPLLLAFAASADDYLWWTIDQDPAVHIEGESDASTGLFWLDYNGDRLWVTDARVKVTSGQGDSYLTLRYDGDPDIPENYMDSIFFYDPDDPEKIKRPVGMVPEKAYAFDVSPFLSIDPATGERTLNPEYSFVVEIGNWDNYDPEVENEGWVVMADYYIPADDVAKHIVENGTKYPESGWLHINEFNAVPGAAPEPTSGVLMLFGLSVLALRRRRVAA